MALSTVGQHRFITILVTSSITLVAVILRLWCKLHLRSGIHADDWWIIVCVVTWYGTVASLIWGIFSGTGGRDVPEVALELQKSPSPEKLLALENFLESLYISVTISFFTLYAAKMSICLFYRRVFSLRQFRLMSTILMAIATAWIIATEVAELVHCIPIDAFWHRSKNIKCLNFNLIFLIVGIFECFLDAAILALPIWAVSTIQMSLKSKITVGGIFCLGGLSIVTNILRVYYTYQPGAEFVSVSQSEFWTNIHVAVTVLCACVPVYQPVRAKIGVVVGLVRSSFSSSIQIVRSYSPRRSSKENSHEHFNSAFAMNDISGSAATNQYYHQGDHFGKDSARDLIGRPSDGLNVTSVSGYDVSNDMSHIPPGSIRYAREVEVV